MLVGLALVFRFAGAAARTGEAALARLLGWLLCACAAWLAGAAAGGFAPVGMALLLGALFSFIDHFERRAAVWVVGEVAVVVACGYVSIPALAPATIAATAGIVVVAGAIIDRVAAPLPRAARLVAVMSPLLLWGGHGLLFADARAEFLQEKWPQIRPALGPFFALARADVGEPVELDTGAVAWLTLPPGPPPYRPALFFHGADEEGAYQRGALFLRRTLTGLGYAVLALDAPGFGASAPPGELRDIDAWDPDPSSLAAARYLTSVPGVEGSVLAVGHSMGATRSLRFLDQWVGASAAVMLGATVMPPAAENERIYDRFLDDFDLEDSGLSPEFVLAVRNRYFNNDVVAGSLPEGHAPLLFVRFAFDYQNIIEGREQLFAMIPGRKVRWELRSDHQFASSRVYGVLMGDWRIMRRLQIALGRFVEGRDLGTDVALPFRPRR